MRTKQNTEKKKDQKINPVNMLLLATIVSGFMYISSLNMKNAGKTENFYSSLERFVIEQVALF